MSDKAMLLRPKRIEVIRNNDTLSVDVKRADYSTYRLATGAGLSRVLQRIGSAVDFMLLTCFRPSDRVNGVDVPRAKSKNEELFKALPGELRLKLETKGIGGYWLVGHWTTCSLEGVPVEQCEAQGGQVSDNLEYSWLFTRDDNAVSQDQWFRAAQDLSLKHNQDAFIIRVNGRTGVYGSDGGILTHLDTDRSIEDAWARLARLRATQTAYGYTELKKLRDHNREQPIVFGDKTAPVPEEPAAEELAAIKEAASYKLAGSGDPHGFEFFLAVPHNNSARMLFEYLGVRTSA